MSSPTIDVKPIISGTIQGAALIGQLAKTISWPPQQPLLSFEPGTGANQMDTWYDAKRTLASAANESLDLNGTALLDPFGAAIAFGHIKLLALYADPANTTDLTIGNGTNPFVWLFGAGANTAILKPGDFIMAARPTTGWVVGAAASDILKVANASGAAATYSILAGGVSV